ncbi:DivIVA domain-containing protein [Micromonospora sp. NBC_01813]|uniref:DivIVA domain-containing protein n=1 Tax=Micromonospora sp. NBC_01813 TaxID=2975988 RepID=UPI002DDA76F8|nr:DivIVA domain-containing protein [Micromonospora sp. NBC_01813]WSA06624.1 DivIVA domain-containing protein [Micromonospora sp. NBC_01813]
MRRILDLFRRPPVRSRRARRLLAEIAQHTRPTTHAAGPRPPVRRAPNAVAHYYGRPVRPSISPGLVRDRQFGDRVRRGCDPTEVRAFLHVVADELTALRAELRSTQDENARIKQALRDWQSEQFQQFQRFGAGVAA